MSDELGNKIQNMFKTVFGSVDIKYMRPIKRQMYLCSAECLNDKNDIARVGQCTEDCGTTTHKAMTIMQKEINSFQGRIDRCLMDCQDSVRDERDETKAKKAFDGCAERCVDKFIPDVPGVVKTLCQKLDNLKRESNIQ